MKIKAVIFDCFGVLVQDSLSRFIDTYLSHSDEYIQRAHELNRQCSLGFISYDDQMKEFAGMAHLDSDSVRAFMDQTPRNIQLLSYIQHALKPSYAISLLSNAGENVVRELFSDDDAGLFDDVLLSYRCGMAKPDPDIYKLSAKRLGLEPRQCLFIDDIDAYVIAARNTGMMSFQYVGFQDFKKQLKSFISIK